MYSFIFSQMCSTSGKNSILHRLKWSYIYSDAHVILPIANKAWITLFNVDDAFGIHVEADQNASKQVPCSWPQSPHYIHNSWKTQTTTRYKPRSVHPHNNSKMFISQDVWLRLLMFFLLSVPLLTHWATESATLRWWRVWRANH